MVSAFGRRAGGVLAIVVLVAAPRLALAQENAPPTLSIPSSHARIGFERIRFPGDGPRVGVVGTSYLIDVGGVRGLALGPAVYGAISGDHGGFFSLGGEVAWRRRLVGPVGVELGLYAGGGGGGGAPPPA